jgi:hypothetical protein
MLLFYFKKEQGVEPISLAAATMNGNAGGKGNPRNKQEIDFLLTKTFFG